ncbi:hypothetical protein M2145_001502 [Lachnospiraceae bacterium PF1-21]
MELKDIFAEINYKVMDEIDKVAILKVNNKKMIFCMENKDNVFVMDRDYFDYLDLNSLPYSLLLYESTRKKYYYIELSKSHNWVKACFESCEKDKIYLGKQVLNAEIDINQLRKEMKKI